MIPTTAGEIATIVGGQLSNLDAATPVTGPVEFDSRKVTPGSVFLCLPGARVDGHDFAQTAAEAGAACSLAARPVAAGAIVVKPLGKQDSNADAFAHDPDGSGAAVLEALGKLARHTVDALADREQSGLPGENLTVVGVTGSAGKTSTKDMMATVLRTAGETVAPKGSFNNEIGHPYTVMTCTEDTKYLVAEMSARGVGHIAHLAEVAPPKFGAVLNVGTAHLGEFGSRDVIAQAKGELVESLPAAEDGGVAILNADDDYVAGMAPRTTAKVVYFSTDPTKADSADYVAKDIELDELARARFTLVFPNREEHPVVLQVSGAHQVSNALAAAAVGVEAGLPTKQVADALSSHVAASERRMDVQTRADGVTVINDSYNANPDSMRAGIDALVRCANARDDVRSWAVLGQMGELGDSATQEHEKLAENLAEQGVKVLVAVGTSANVCALAEKARQLGLNTVRVANTDEAANAVSESISSDDVVLVKASYADGLWRVADALLADEHVGQNLSDKEAN
ncbi:UDP-N-acetylmuramoyl-tripeptide--D-alanyl-D-alanine ligase [Corynebacterium sp. H113]|uniref:UDP-N-acetylmuramoyl-tripeptide--D-alanyl-D- alanine ligase n=1 Tax=Corynebacterium sp. H113 TaxID=3133419 RepID=UPI00309F997D